MRPPCLTSVQHPSTSLLPRSVHLRRLLLCRLVAHHSQVLDPEVQELVYRLEGACDRYIVLELNGHWLARQRLEEGEDQLRLWGDLHRDNER